MPITDSMVVVGVIGGSMIDFFRIAMERNLAEIIKPVSTFTKLNLGAGNKKITGTVELDYPEWDGEKDEIIPKEPTYAFLHEFLATDAKKKTVAIYPQGYHMLLRDLQAPTAWNDIVAWIDTSPDRLPSGADNRAMDLFRP